MQFALIEWTDATCTHVNKRTENHGDEPVHCKDLFWHIDSSNDMLDRIDPTLRPTLYVGSASRTIPGVPHVTAELRCRVLEGPFKVAYEGSGYSLVVRYGEISEDTITLDGAEMAKLTVNPKQDGVMETTFRTSHKGLSMAQMGRLDTFDGKKLSITLIPPAEQEAPRSHHRKKKDPDTLPLDLTPVQQAKRLVGKVLAEAPDAGDIFVAHHGNSKAAPKVTFKAKAGAAAAKKAAAAAKKAKGARS